MKKWHFSLALLLVFALVLAACGGGGTTPPPAQTTQQGQQPAATPTPAPDANVTDDEPAQVLDAGEVRFGQLPGTLPRNESLFFGGLSWGPPNNSNPFAPNPNNPMVVVQAEAVGSRLFVFETLYMFSMVDGELRPLLASGPPQWNADRTILTVNMNRDAHWSDGTPLTAHDVVATFDMHVRVNSSMGAEFGAFISQIVAVNDHTVELHTNPDNYNPLQLMSYINRVYVTQAAFLEERWAHHNGSASAFMDDDWNNAPHSGPYRPAFYSSTMVVLERDDNYWGQAPSMWGRLPVPRFLVHNIYANNDIKRASFAAGQIDVNQQFMANVWDLWETDGLPVSTFLDRPPFYISGTMPSIWFNTTRPGLDQRVVRQAIAFAIDYEQIIAAAMSGYSPTFIEAPRSIAVPLAAEQAFVDNAALADLQWANADIERANRILDEAGIVDTTGNGIRDIDGVDLSFTLMCPAGWSDWNTSLEIVAAAGAAIGIDLSTNFVEAAVWTESQQTGDFDIVMIGTAQTGIASPWTRAFSALYVPDPNADRFFWAWHRMYNPEINELITRASVETDMAVLREYYTIISRFILEEMPLVYLMYRPVHFHTVNESVWTGFPEYGDGTNIPPNNLATGYSIAGLYNLRLVNP